MDYTTIKSGDLVSFYYCNMKKNADYRVIIKFIRDNVGDPQHEASFVGEIINQAKNRGSIPSVGNTYSYEYINWEESQIINQHKNLKDLNLLIGLLCI